jgi:hypothetical protein
MQPYQYQIGSVLFGRNTDIPVSKVEVQPYNVNQQDFQVIRTDETRFGIDTLAPAPIVFTMAVMDNFALEQISHIAGPDLDDLFLPRGSLLSSLARTWKASDVRAFWGQVMPLLCCKWDGTVVRIYGRPGKFQYAKRANDRTTWIEVQAEFRRGDTLAHSDIEYYVGDITNPLLGMAPGAPAVVAQRGDGDGDSWLRFVFTGPMTHPIVNYGDKTLEMTTSIPAGVSVEVSTYPWVRRVVDSNSVNRRTEVIGNTLYLDQINFPADDAIEVSWDCDDADTSTGLYFMWREAYNVI